MTDWQRTLERETAAHILAGGRACPLYRMPAWACSTLHLITGLCRTVTSGAFHRFTASFDGPPADDSGIYRFWIAEWYCCPHDPEAIGHTYWSTAAASTVDPQQLAIQGGP